MLPKMSQDTLTSIPARDYLKPEVIKRANEILWERKREARLKHAWAENMHDKLHPEAKDWHE